MSSLLKSVMDRDVSAVVAQVSTHCEKLSENKAIQKVGSGIKTAFKVKASSDAFCQILKYEREKKEKSPSKYATINRYVQQTFLTSTYYVDFDQIFTNLKKQFPEIKDAFGSVSDFSNFCRDLTFKLEKHGLNIKTLSTREQWDVAYDFVGIATCLPKRFFKAMPDGLQKTVKIAYGVLSAIQYGYMAQDFYKWVTGTQRITDENEV